MARINDVGGVESFGSIDTTETSEPFHRDWEARIYALQFSLLRQRIYTLDEFRDAIERLSPSQYLSASYYERWLGAIETLLVERGIVDATALADALNG